MTLCSACRKDFSAPAGQTVPYRCPHCQTVVLGPYCDLEWIGGGGMGDVYRARDPQMGNRTVAIKIPLTEINPERAKQRFEREIAASALLQHENTVRAYQRGQEGGRPYLVMEFVSGRKLSDVVREEHPLSARRVGRIILGVAEALAHAEQKGVVNRDVKPGNVILAETNETPKVLDYGLALILGFEDEVTRSGSQLGTPSFMAPEQVRDPHSVAISADVYSLACTAFYCLAGRAPFQAPTTSDLYSLHAEAARPRIRQVRPDVAEEFDKLIRWMMTADPRQRPTPRQVVQTLEPLVAELSDRPPLPEPKADEGLIDVTCQSCDTLYHLSRDWVGKRFRCSNRLCGEVLTIELPEGIPTASPAELTGGSIDLSELPEAEIVEAEPVGAAEAAEDDEEEARETIDGGTPPMIVETAIAEEADSHSDVEMLPSEAVVPAEVYDGSFDRLSASPGALPAEPVDSEPVGAEPTSAEPAEAEMLPEAELPPGTRKRSIVPFGRRKGRRAQTPKPPKKRKTARERRATRMKWAVGGLCAVLLIGSAITLWLSWDSLRPATPEERWATIMDDYVDHKWDRVVRDLEKFEHDFPDDPHVAQIPFFRDLCDAGANIYSLTGDPEQGWESLKQIYMTHRDSPAYKDYSIDIYQGLVKTLERLIEQAIETSDPEKLALVREVYELLETVGRSREEPFVAEAIAKLGSRIAQVEHRLAGLQAREEVVRLLDPQQIADPSVNVDEIYAEVEVVLAKNPGLREDRDLMALLDDAYGAEPRRLHYLQEEPDAQAALPVTDSRDRTRQGYTLVVAWGNVDDDRLPPEAERMVFALARGMLYAFDKREGSLCWARRLGIDSQRLPIQVRPTATSPPSLIAVNSEDNRLLSLEPSTGEVLWRYRVGQHIVAPLSIVPRQTDPNAPITHYGLLPTTEGEIHVLELVLGKRLGVFDVGHPITLGGCYDRETGLAFFAADAKRIFAIDPAAVDDPERSACRSILFSDHASGSLRSEPVVVGQYLIVSEASELEHTRLKVFAVEPNGFSKPTMPPLENVSLNGWAWFSPDCTPDRITLVTDQGDLGLFGLNLDNRAEAIYSIVEPKPGQPTVQLPSRDMFRTMAIHAEEHLLWVITGGSLQKLSVDVLDQEIVPVWSKGDDAPDLNGIPIHEPQIDRADGVFYLTTMSPSGHSYRFMAIDSNTGDPRWKCRLGIDVWGDPIVWDERLVFIDRTGQTCYFRPQDSFVESDKPRTAQFPDHEGLPPGADPRELMRLGAPPGSIHLVVPVDDATKLAVKTIDNPTTDVPPWIVQVLPARLHGRPCVCDDFLVVPCRDGHLHRVSLDGKPVVATNEVPFQWARSKPPGPNTADAYPLAPKTILLVDDDRSRVQRLRLQTTAEGVIQWQEEGTFHLSGALQGQPLLLDDRLFVFDSSGVLRCLDPANPNRVLGEWPVEVEVAAGPFVRGGSLLAITKDARLVSLEVDDPNATRQPRWITEPFRGWIRGMPAVVDDTLLVADSSRRVTGIGLDDGKPVWTAPLGMRVGPSAAPVPYGKGRMMVPLVDGTLFVLPIPEEEEEQVAEARP